MEVPRLRGELELQLPAYTTATAKRDLSHVCDLHHSSRQHRILHPLSEARDQACNLVVPHWIRFCCATMGTLKDAGFCYMLFFCIYWDDHVLWGFFILLMCIILIDFWMLNQLCIPGINPPLLCCIYVFLSCTCGVRKFPARNWIHTTAATQATVVTIPAPWLVHHKRTACTFFEICCWIWFASVLLRVFTYIFLRNIDLEFSCRLFLVLAIRIMLASQNDFRNVSSSSSLYKSLWTISFFYNRGSSPRGSVVNKSK